VAHIALLVVHGIGAQERGDTLAKLAKGLRHPPNSVPDTIRDGMAATIGGQEVRLYEVYWADRLKGDLTHGAFQLDELQSVSWFPWYNVRCGNYRAGSYSFLKRAWWIVVLPILNFFILWAYYGARFFAQVFTGERDSTPKRSESAIEEVWKTARRRRTEPTALDDLLDEYVGDVFSYVNSAGHAFFRDAGAVAVVPEVEKAYAEIVSRFYEQLLRARADGADTIQVVAHSLGTVVAYHAMSGFGFDPQRPDADDIRGALSSITRFYTIGSPLEKIRFFWPRIVPYTEPRRDITLRWANFVSYFDPVAGVLRTFDDWGPIANRHLLGGGFVRGHVVYERSPVFLGALTEGLCGRAIRYPRSWMQRLWDSLVLAGETFVAPLTLLAVVAVGVMFFLLVAALLPLLVSLPFRLFVQQETWAPWVDGTWYILLAMMFLTFVIAPWNRARKVHALYWGAKRAEPAARQET